MGSINYGYIEQYKLQLCMGNLKYSYIPTIDSADERGQYKVQL
jgi:hypothetical protein